MAKKLNNYALKINNTNSQTPNMKKTILFLPGMSKKNKALVEEAKKLFENVQTIEYNHWKSGKEIDIEKEKQKLSGTYDVVIAKSIGAS